MDRPAWPSSLVFVGPCQLSVTPSSKPAMKTWERDAVSREPETGTGSNPATGLVRATEG